MEDDQSGIHPKWKPIWKSNFNNPNDQISHNQTKLN